MTQITSFSDQISTSTEVDRFKVNLEAGSHYSFDITGQTSKNSTYTLGNPVIKIYSPDGVLLARQDYSTLSTGQAEGASLMTLDPHLAFTAGSSGQYTVTVESQPVAQLARDWDLYLPNSGQTVDNLNSTGTYKLDVNSYTNAELVDPVIGNYRWMDHAGDARGTGATIYYDFATNNLGKSTSATTNLQYGWNSIHSFKAADQAKIDGWLTEFESVANINFVRADNSHPATMHLMLGTSGDGSQGTAWLYGKDGYQFNAGDFTTDEQLGRVDLLIDTIRWTEAGINSGSGYALFMHKMGHALGVKHPGNYTGWDATKRFENAAYDNTTFSQMSYNDNWQSGFATNGQALKLLDIAALQTLYGAKSNTNSTNTTWSFNNASVEYSTTIHDTGGIDTLDASGQSIGSVINLQPGALSSIGNLYVPADKSALIAYYKVDGVFGDKAYNNIGISLDTLIENAKGGIGNDHIIGNSANNVLTGNGGNDILNGGAGNDNLNGGAGADTMLGGSGNDTYYVNSTLDQIFETTSSGSTTDSGGIDTVIASCSWTLGSNLEKLTLTGTTAINGTGNTLNNTIKGNTGANILTGGLGSDSLYGGLDTLKDVFDFNLIAESKTGKVRDKLFDFLSGTDH